MAVIAAESVTDVEPVQAAVTKVPVGMPVPDTTEPVLMPVASATTIAAAPEAAVAVVAVFSTVLAFSSSETARAHVEVSLVQK